MTHLEDALLGLQVWATAQYAVAKMVIYWKICQGSHIFSNIKIASFKVFYVTDLSF